MKMTKNFEMLKLIIELKILYTYICMLLYKFFIILII